MRLICRNTFVDVAEDDSGPQVWSRTQSAPAALGEQRGAVPPDGATDAQLHAQPGASSPGACNGTQEDQPRSCAAPSMCTSQSSGSGEGHDRHSSTARGMSTDVGGSTAFRQASSQPDSSSGAAPAAAPALTKGPGAGGSSGGAGGGSEAPAQPEPCAEPRDGTGEEGGPEVHGELRDIAGPQETPGPMPASSARPMATGHAIDRAVPRLTYMLWNLPVETTRDGLVDMLNREGFYASFDFIYVPIRFGPDVNFGYAFVNMVSPEAADELRTHFQGFTRWDIDRALTEKEALGAHVTPANNVQGFQANVDRYRNSPLLHPAFPDRYKPAVFQAGVRVPFPPPTEEVRAPRLRLRP